MEDPFTSCLEVKIIEHPMLLYDNGEFVKTQAYETQVFRT